MSWINLVATVCGLQFGNSELASNINKASAEFNVDKIVILSVIYNESRCMPNVVGADNDSGLMQVVPKWHKNRMELLGVDNLFDPLGNIRVGSHLLRELEVENNLRKALAMYNGGYVPPQSSWDYADRVINDYHKFKTYISLEEIWTITQNFGKL